MSYREEEKVFTVAEVEALLVKVGERVGADILALARGEEPRLNTDPLPAVDEQMFADREAALKRLGGHTD